MFAAHIATHTLSHVSTMAVWLFQDQQVAWDPISLWKQMGFIARSVVVILFIMSGWSIGVMIDRAMAFSAARKQSRAFAPAVAGALRDGKIDEAIKVAERNKKSHLAKVVTAGLMEFRAHQESGEIPGETIEASKRALERTEAIVHAELKRGLGGLATIGSAPRAPTPAPAPNQTPNNPEPATRCDPASRAPSTATPPPPPPPTAP